MIMFGHNPELLLAGSETPKLTEIEGKLSGNVTLSFQAKKEHLISQLWHNEEPFGVCVGWVWFKIKSLFLFDSTNIATKNIKCNSKGKKICFHNESLPCRFQSVWRASWFIHKQKTHVSRIISPCLKFSLLSLQAGSSSRRGLKCACLNVCFCLQRSLTHSTHTLCDI